MFVHCYSHVVQRLSTAEQFLFTTYENALPASLYASLISSLVSSYVIDLLGTIMTTMSQILMNRVDEITVLTAIFTDDTSSTKYHIA